MVKEKINDNDEIKELTNQLKEYKHHHKMYIRILAVRMVKIGESRTKTGEYLHINRQTVGKWVKNYEEKGIDGLDPDYSNCGVKSRLNDEQLAELYEILTDPESHYTIKQARKLIKDKYNVEYSIKQVWVITRLKFGLNYRKPFIRYHEEPPEAKEDFKKKTIKIDLETEDLTVLDEAGAQNTIKSARCLCSPTINGFKDPNIIVKSGLRFGTTAVGFQGINCPSFLYFNQKNNSSNFVIALCNYQISRIENQEAINILYDIVNDPKIDYTNIKIELLKEKVNEEVLEKIYDKNHNIITKKLNYYCTKNKINAYKIGNRQRKYLKERLNNKRLIYLLQNERKLNIILDNARIHTAKFVEEMCEILSINLVFLPPYCPFLNPIEDVWKDIKRELYISDFKTLNDLKDLFSSFFYEIVDNVSYYENWLNEYFDINLW